MLIHEIKSGRVESVGGLKFVRPPEAQIAMPLPDHLDVFEEPDGTHTVSGPIYFTDSDGTFAYYMIHGSWSRHRVGG